MNTTCLENSLIDVPKEDVHTPAISALVQALHSEVNRERNVMVLVDSYSTARILRQALSAFSKDFGVDPSHNESKFEACNTNPMVRVIVLPYYVAETGIAPHQRFDTMYFCSIAHDRESVIQTMSRILRGRALDPKWIVCADLNSVHGQEFNTRRLDRAQRAVDVMSEYAEGRGSVSLLKFEV